MIMTLNELQTSLKLPRIPEAFRAVYKEIADSWEDKAYQILSDAYIAKTLTDCCALAPYRQDILAAAGEIRKDPALCLWVCIMERLVREGSVLSDPDYCPPEGEGLGYDFLHLFPAIPTMPDSVAFLRSRNVPEDVIVGTMQEYDRSVATYKSFFKKPGFDKARLNWLRQVIRNNLMQIGRLRFELPQLLPLGIRVYRNSCGALTILADNLQVHSDGRAFGSAGHKEEDSHFFAQITETGTTLTGYPVENGLVQKAPITLEKSRWTQCLSAQDPVIKIHIPREGSFDRQAILDSYTRAREVFAACYPDYPYKAFYCASWLLSADLQKLLKPTSNILGFQKDFTRFPFRSSGRGIFSFVYSTQVSGEPDWDALPQNTSLQRAIKEHCVNGGYIHEDAGFLF